MIHLASTSPQRAALLRQAGIVFQVVASDADEERVQHEHPSVLALERARVKAEGVRLAACQPGRHGIVVLAADTVVALDGQAIGKPVDRADARAILRRLQGTTHGVITGHCCRVLAPDGALIAQALRVATARITMRAVADDEIAAYVDSGESDGRAGAYAIQEHGDRFVIDRQGSWDTVVGLQVALVVRMHQECTGHLPEGSGP